MKQWRSSLMVVAVVCCLALVGCNKSDVSLVKDGVLEVDKSLTVGQAFDNYKWFKQTQWQAIKTENGKRIVEVKAKVKLDDNPTFNKPGSEVSELEVQYQFVINQDKTFQVGWCGIEVVKTDGTVIEPNKEVNLLRCSNSLKSIYNNTSDI